MVYIDEQFFKNCKRLLIVGPISDVEKQGLKDFTKYCGENRVGYCEDAQTAIRRKCTVADDRNGTTIVLLYEKIWDNALEIVTSLNQCIILGIKLAQRILQNIIASEGDQIPYSLFIGNKNPLLTDYLSNEKILYEGQQIRKEFIMEKVREHNGELVSSLREATKILLVSAQSNTIALITLKMRSPCMFLKTDWLYQNYQTLDIQKERFQTTEELPLKGFRCSYMSNVEMDSILVDQLESLGLEFNNGFKNRTILIVNDDYEFNCKSQPVFARAHDMFVVKKSWFQKVASSKCINEPIEQYLGSKQIKSFIGEPTLKHIVFCIDKCFISDRVSNAHKMITRLKGSCVTASHAADFIVTDTIHNIDQRSVYPRIVNWKCLHEFYNNSHGKTCPTHHAGFHSQTTGTFNQNIRQVCLLVSSKTDKSSDGLSTLFCEAVFEQTSIKCIRETDCDLAAEHRDFPRIRFVIDDILEKNTSSRARLIGKQVDPSVIFLASKQIEWFEQESAKNKVLEMMQIDASIPTDDDYLTTLTSEMRQKIVENIRISPTMVVPAYTRNFVLPASNILRNIENVIMIHLKSIGIDADTSERVIGEAVTMEKPLILHEKTREENCCIAVIDFKHSKRITPYGLMGDVCMAINLAPVYDFTFPASISAFAHTTSSYTCKIMELKNGQLFIYNTIGDCYKEYKCYPPILLDTYVTLKCSTCKAACWRDEIKKIKKCDQPYRMVHEDTENLASAVSLQLNENSDGIVIKYCNGVGNIESLQLENIILSEITKPYLKEKNHKPLLPTTYCTACGIPTHLTNNKSTRKVTVKQEQGGFKCVICNNDLGTNILIKKTS